VRAALVTDVARRGIGIRLVNVLVWSGGLVDVNDGRVCIGAARVVTLILQSAGLAGCVAPWPRHMPQLIVLMRCHYAAVRQYVAAADTDTDDVDLGGRHPVRLVAWRGVASLCGTVL